MQNQYNNYLKRQKQQPINNFKEKVKNSLNGKTINNTTMPNTAQANIQNKVRAMTPNNGTSTIGSGSASGVTTPVQTSSNTNTNITTPNASQTPLNASETPSVVNAPVEANQIENNIEGGAGMGMMSLSDINNTMARSVENPNARSTSNSYKDLLEQNRNDQLAQADKDWAIQEDAFNKQIENLQSQYKQSVTDANNAYKESVDTLNQQRYNQMEELNVSGTNRGIQYSPQQLGLENVANINHNKNLAETSKTRNELLNKLQIELQNSLTQLNTTIANSRNEYNKNKLDINSNYYNTLVSWGREDEQTQNNRDWEQKLLEEKRKWEEEQAQKDKEFQQMMQELQNKFDKEQQNSQNNWQSGENKLDREHDKAMAKSGRSSYGRSSYGYSSGGYGGYSRSYNPWTNYYNGYDSYDGGSVDLNDDIEARAYQSVFNDVSDDSYSAYTSLKSPYNASSRAIGYASEVDDMIEYAKNNGASSDTLRNLYNTRDKAMKQLFEDHSGYKNYSGDAIKRGDDKVKFYKKNVTNSLDRTIANQAERVMNGMRKTKTEDKKKTTTKKTNKTVEKVKKSVSNSAKNLKKNTNTKKTSKKTQKAIANSKKNVNKSLNNAKKNVKKSTKNAKKNVKKSVANSKKNVKKSTNNALKNLKKNIGKLFGKK